MNQQVASLNSIINTVEFYTNPETNSEYYQGLNFKIFRTKIYESTKCNNYSTAEQLLCQNYLDPTTFLNYISQDDFSNYCEGMVFTARDFGDGTLGLAWLASPTASGGACETTRVNSNNRNLSLNTGFVTLVNYNTRQPDKLSQITFAHEMGHAFGSTHDKTSGCVLPDDRAEGNFIMYARAVRGDKANNANFSSCSKYLIGGMLDVIVQKKNCFNC